MYEYKDAGFVQAGTEHWVAAPVRPRGLLVLGFVGMIAYIPVWCVLAVVKVAGFIVCLLLADIVDSVSDSGGRKLVAMSDRMLERLRLPGWCVTWPEMRHEGDTAYHRARVDKVVGRWTARASAPRKPNKPLWPVECEIPWSVYRGVGGHYVVETATAQGWELRPSEPQTSVRLWWSAATRDEAGTDTAE